MSQPPHASVLIPVKNGGPLLEKVVDAVLSQSTTWSFECIAVDSGSTDGSLELLKRKGVECHVISPSEFGHGKTRNLLASHARGQFLVYITQDAIPAHKAWLSQLVAGCEARGDVAGAFGPQIAHQGARFITQEELRAHFSGFGEQLTVVSLEDRERYDRDVGYRQFLHFFSSNNSCIRKSAWEKINFPDVNFAEDQSWALRMIEAGYAKAFVPDAPVYHSHDFGVFETLQRNFDESRSFSRYFGYEMQPSLRRAVRSWLALSKRDAAWLRKKSHSPSTHAGQMAHMVALEGARVLGQYLGTKHEILPASVNTFLSRDEGIQKR